MAANNGPNEPGAVEKSQRRANGTFGQGNKFSRGRPPTSLTRELRRVADMPALALKLHAMALDDTLPKREQLEAMKLIWDRLEGKSISRSVNFSASAAALPVGFSAMEPAQKAQILAELRERALQGALPPGDDESEGSDDGEA